MAFRKKNILGVTIGLLLLVIFGGITLKTLENRKIKLDEVVLKNDNTNSDMFAIMVENSDGGYDTFESESWPSGYKYNATKSGCIDSSGNTLTDILSFDSATNKAILKTKEPAFCYLYFDIDSSVYAKLVSDYNNSNGVSKISSTSAETGNTYDAYYYTGSITNNNILYANHCWKMVISTETKGVKLIYNGVPTTGTDDAGNTTYSCDNTGTASQLSSTKAFNSSYNSPAYVGYMYNTAYKYTSKALVTATNVLTRSSMSSSSSYTYYYGDTAVWNEDIGKYDLKLSDGTDVTEATAWSSSTYSSFVGKYTCRSTSTTTGTSCATVYYVAGSASSYMYHYALTNNTKKEDYKIKLSAEAPTDNGDGTYTLVNPIEVVKADYYSNYSTYKNYYYCSDLTSETCSNMYYSTSTNVYQLSGYNMANNYVYGNSFEPGEAEGTYKLTDSKNFYDWYTNYNTLNSNHYTCFNTSGECTDLNYIYYTNNTTAYYITLTGGKTVEEAINEMLYADDVNTTDSTIKDYIDTWYEGSVVGQTDSSGNLYSSYLENAIFCNNREMTNQSSNGWNPNGGSTTTYMYFNYNSLECENKTDRFTLKTSMGGTEGYGNNALDYPIGLISYKEASLATASGYLKSGSNYWLLSPNYFNFYFAGGYFVYSGGSLNLYYVISTSGVRPAVSLSSSVEITGGDGSVSSPYLVKIAE